MTTAVELKRANKISVQTMDDGSFEAKLSRTHKHLLTVNSKDTTFTPNPTSNKTAQREQFRDWMANNAPLWGIQYDAEDRRIDDYKLPAKYTSDDVLKEAAVAILAPDINKWVADMMVNSVHIAINNVEAEDIIEIDKTGKGTSVSPKYLNGNWAWAKIKVVITATLLGTDKPAEELTEGYVTMTVDLVSGQLRKPSNIGEYAYTQTGFRMELAKDIPEVKPTIKSEIISKDEGVVAETEPGDIADDINKSNQEDNEEIVQSTESGDMDNNNSTPKSSKGKKKAKNSDAKSTNKRGKKSAE